MGECGDAGDTTQKIGRRDRLSSGEIAGRLERDEAPLLVDVRSPGEWEASHVEGAVNIPLRELPARLDELPTDRELITMCQTGYRSSTAASLMALAGRSQIADAEGGIEAWINEGHPVV